MRLYWCEEHERVADHAWVEGDARVWACSMCDQTGFLGAKSERLLVDPSFLPEHAVEAVARVLSIEICGEDESYDPGCMAQHRTEARAAIRGFLESLSEEEK